MKVLLINQTFYPDVVSTAQHATDLARRLVECGHPVTVIAGARGYDNPKLRFSRRDDLQGIEIIRIPCSGFGKGAKWRRALDFATFMASAVYSLLRQPGYDVVLAMTSPPLISLLGALFTRLKGGHFLFWVMDLNPDEAIAAGWLRAESWSARGLGALLRYSLTRAARIVVLDRFMKQRLMEKGVSPSQIAVIPPWSHDDAIRYDPEGRMTFRAQQGLQDKYVVMYSGNHSPCHPLDTLLQAAALLAHRRDIAFCFVGGGSEFEKVKAFACHRNLENIICLPYQPLNALSASLSAADLHVVVMGEPFAGIVHPCKIYNILTVGKPFLYIGASQSHVTDIIARMGRTEAYTAAHGDTDAVVRHILTGARRAATRPVRYPARVPLAAHFSKRALLPQMIQVLESVALLPVRAPARSSLPGRLVRRLSSHIHSLSRS